MRSTRLRLGTLWLTPVVAPVSLRSLVEAVARARSRL